MEKQYLNPNTLPIPKGYTQVVTAQGGRTIYISGQVPITAEGEIVGKGDFREQTIHTFQNLKRALAAAGATFSDVVKMTIFVVNYMPEDHYSIIREVRNRFVDGGNLPASTLVGVQALFDKDVQIEIEAIAVVG